MQAVAARTGGDGDLCIVLHSHMPYVEGFGTWPFGEEWLLEAIASCYLPLIELLERWANRGLGEVATLGVTPVLADQLSLGAVHDHFLEFVRQTRARCHNLDIVGFERDGQRAAADALRRSRGDYERAATQFEARGGDLLGALDELRRAGAVDLWTSAATHSVLPLVATEPGLRLQVLTGIESHRRRFGAWSGGFWLPECAYRPGTEAVLEAAGVRAFCVDQTDHGDALDQLEPVETEAGPLAVPIDWSMIELVWDPRGYPADPLYRDYHRHTLNGLCPWSNGGAPYDHEAAARRTRDHARDFVGRVLRRMADYRSARGRRALVVLTLDTELLGHWWYEGPMWLDGVLAEATAAGVSLAALPRALERHSGVSRALAASTWGESKDMRTWDSPEVADLVWRAREAELALVAALAERPPRNGSSDAALRAARELLALQSSDWAFMTSRRLAGDYPRQRVAAHTADFEESLAAVRRAVQDFRAMSPDEPRSSPKPRRAAALRGLAPEVALCALLEPASPWGRQRFDGAVQ